MLIGLCSKNNVGFCNVHCNARNNIFIYIQIWKKFIIFTLACISTSFLKTSIVVLQKLVIQCSSSNGDNILYFSLMVLNIGIYKSVYIFFDMFVCVDVFVFCEFHFWALISLLLNLLIKILISSYEKLQIKERLLTMIIDGHKLILLIEII